MSNEITNKVKIQYPTNDVRSLQRSITQIKELLEDSSFWGAVTSVVGLSGGDAATGCCSNVDGGQADSNYGGVFCPIDGGNVIGAANTTS